MNHPKYAPLVAAEYQARFGGTKAEDEDEGCDKDDDDDDDVGGEKEGRDKAEQGGSDVDGDGEDGDDGGEDEDDGDGNEGDEDDRDEGDKKEGNKSEEEGGGGERQYALSRRVLIAKELYDQLSEDEKAVLQNELEEQFAEKCAAYQRSLNGEDLFNPESLPE